MSGSTFIQSSPQARIRDLEKCIVMGDVAGMARNIAELHANWDNLSEDMQKDIQKLEAIFLSLVHIKTEGNA